MVRENQTCVKVSVLCIEPRFCFWRNNKCFSGQIDLWELLVEKYYWYIFIIITCTKIEWTTLFLMLSSQIHTIHEYNTCKLQVVQKGKGHSAEYCVTATGNVQIKTKCKGCNEIDWKIRNSSPARGLFKSLITTVVCAFKLLYCDSLPDGRGEKKEWLGCEWSWLCWLCSPGSMRYRWSWLQGGLFAWWTVSSPSFWRNNDCPISQIYCGKISTVHSINLSASAEAMPSSYLILPHLSSQRVKTFGMLVWTRSLCQRFPAWILLLTAGLEFATVIEHSCGGVCMLIGFLMVPEQQTHSSI